MKKETRICWLDAARGVGIVLVVLGHMDIPLAIRTVIFSFHLPLFFIMSGYVLNETKSIRSLIQSRVTGLLIPYYVFLALFLLFAVPFRTALDFPYDVSAPSIRLALLGMHAINEPAWFLVALFSVSVVMILLRSWYTTPLRLLGFAGLLLAGTWLIKIPICPLRANHVFIAGFFYLVGILLHRTDSIHRAVRLTWGSFAGILLVGSMVYAGLMYGLGERPDMVNMRYGHHVFYFLGTGIVASYLLMVALARVERMVPPWLLQPWIYLGQRSLYILVAHEPVAAITHYCFKDGLPFRLDRLMTIVLLVIVIEALAWGFSVGKRLFYRPTCVCVSREKQHD